MLKLGTIGTSWITTAFIDAAHASGKYKLTTVHSRNQDTAISLSSKFNAQPTTTLPITGVDVVYIASPNSHHYNHAHMHLSQGINVIVEKPATTTLEELRALLEVAEKQGVFILEAYRHLHDPSFGVVVRNLPRLGSVYGASLTFASYSSRYDLVVAGTQPPPNIFNPAFGGGCLVDLGVYCISFAVALFGKPTGSSYFPDVCSTGVDVSGGVILSYADKGFSVNINQSKRYKSFAPSEIYGSNGTMVIEGTTGLVGVHTIRFWDRKTDEMVDLFVSDAAENLPLQGEADEFARIIQEKDWTKAKRLADISLNVVGVTECLRIANGIVFGVQNEGDRPAGTHTI